LDSLVQQRAASVLNHVGHYYSSPALSGGSLMTVKLKPQFHSADQ